MKIVVLGGAGKMGCVSVQDLARHELVEEVIIADINQAAAEAVAAFLNNPKVKIQPVDMEDMPGLVKVLAEADACVNATVYYTNLNVMEACLQARTHYTDMGGLFHTTREQLKLHERYEAAGISAVLGMGSAPGIPNIQSRYAADRLDTIEYIHIYDGIRPPNNANLKFTYAVPTIIDEMTLAPMIYRDGQFVECAPMGEPEDYWFANPLGLMNTHLSLHSEVATLPITFAEKGIQDCFFKINYWGMSQAVVAKVNTLAEFGLANREAINVQGQPVVPRDMLVALMSEYAAPVTDSITPPTSQPPDWVKEIVTEVKGTQAGKTVTYRLGTLTCKSPLPTGVVPARGAVWQAAGRISAGVYPPEQVFDAEVFLKELEDVQIFTQVTVTQGI
jgi:lysine 6-dehydrogenase